MIMNELNSVYSDAWKSNPCLDFAKKLDFKACVRYFYQIFIFPPNDSLLKTMKNVFYFI